jgi:cell surface protein SprA
MIGVRNADRVKAIDRILWVNEIRLSEIENDGGYAGNASLNFNLGDLQPLIPMLPILQLVLEI